jgi:hypothetical protein
LQKVPGEMDRSGKKGREDGWRRRRRRRGRGRRVREGWWRVGVLNERSYYGE